MSDESTWTGPGGVYTPKQMQFTSGGARGQGPNPSSPGWFLAGDHVLVSFNGAVYDPSYGTGPFVRSSACEAVGCWADASLAGLAEVESPDHSAGSPPSIESAQPCPAVPPPGLGLEPYECRLTVTDVAPGDNWNYAPPTP